MGDATYSVLHYWKMKVVRELRVRNTDKLNMLFHIKYTTESYWDVV